MTQKTQLGTLRDDLEQALSSLKSFDDFRSPLNEAAARIMYENLPDGMTVKVAIRDPGGLFYRGKIYSMRPDGTSFGILADDGDLVYGVTARMFVSVMVVPAIG